MRYGFLQGPRTVQEFDANKGIIFLVGQFDEWVIDKFVLFTNGVLAEAKVPTEKIDAFLDDIIAWGRNELGKPPLDANTIKRSYLSQIEIEMDFQLGELMPEYAELGKWIADTSRAYGQNTPTFEFSGLTLHADMSDVPMPRPGIAFSLVRRENQPYSSKLYFASASLSTPDLLKAVQMLQNIILRKASTAKKATVS
jgi:hypothetical protein